MKLLKNTTYQHSINNNNNNNQIKVVSLIILATLIPVSLILILFKLKTNASLSILTRDPSVIAKVPFYVGLFSNIGILFWCACAALCVFSYFLLTRDSKPNKISSFLLNSGFLTAVLLLDDFFMLHEEFFPKYLNINSNLIISIYILFTLYLFLNNIKIIKRTEFFILLLAIASFGLSIILDIFNDKGLYNIPIVLEDIFKLLGITSWFTYFARVCWQELRNAIRS